MSLVSNAQTGRDNVMMTTSDITIAISNNLDFLPICLELLVSLTEETGPRLQPGCLVCRQILSLQRGWLYIECYYTRLI